MSTFRGMARGCFLDGGLLAAARSDDGRPVLRIAVSGGASLPVAVIGKFDEVFGADIYEGYELSETSPVATFDQPAFGRKAGTVGRAIWGTDAETADAKTNERIRLLVVTSSGGADLQEADLIAWSQERLGKHKYPRRVQFVESLPLGPSRKVLKRERERPAPPTAAPARVGQQDDRIRPRMYHPAGWTLPTNGDGCARRS